jgi:ABC-type transporter Mla MlaB component
MAFGIFKKNEERMAPPKAAKAPVAPPKPAPQAETARKPETAAPGKAPAEQAKAPIPPAQPVAPAKPATEEFDDLESLDFTGITIHEEKDPIDAAIEEAAVAFANGDNGHCEAVLKDSLRVFEGMPGTEVLWLMLFDLYRAIGKREPFVAMEMDYAKRFEKQPPVWRDVALAAATSTGAAGATLFKGELLASNAAGLDALAQVVEKSDKPRLDLSRVKEVDAAGADRLLEIIARGKKLKHPVELLGMDALVKILDPKVKAKEPGQGIWRLLLECYQRQAKQEVFDEVALEFAITFEVQPPEYVAPLPSAKKVAAAAAAAKPVEAPPSDGALYLTGNMTGGGRIEGLDTCLNQEKAIIDMSGVNRLDFACAGVLLTAVRPAFMRGVSVVIRYPSHLIAALLKVVGVADIATIVNARH